MTRELARAPLTPPADGTFVATHGVRVGYVDTDKAGVVHHSVYLAWLEAARIEYWRARGLDYRAFEVDTGMAMPVVDLRVRYRAPARFDDVLAVQTWVSSVSRAKVVFDAHIRREGELLIEARVVVACVQLAEGRVVSIPPRVAAASA